MIGVTVNLSCSYDKNIVTILMVQQYNSATHHHLSISLSIHPSIHPFTHPPTHPSIHPPINVPSYVPIYLYLRHATVVSSQFSTWCISFSGFSLSLSVGMCNLDISKVFLSLCCSSFSRAKSPICGASCSDIVALLLTLS